MFVTYGKKLIDVEMTYLDIGNRKMKKKKVLMDQATGLLYLRFTKQHVVGSVELVVASGDSAIVDLPVDLDVQVLPDPVDLDGVPRAVVDLDLRRGDRQLCGINSIKPSDL